MRCYGEYCIGSDRGSPQQERETEAGKVQEFGRGRHARTAETGYGDLKGRWVRVVRAWQCQIFYLLILHVKYLHLLHG